MKKFTDLHVTDYANLLHLTGEYRLAELRIETGDWLGGKTLAGSRLRKEGINVLGIKKKDGSYIGDLSGDIRIHQEDCLVIYGRIDSIEALDKRKKGTPGDVEHLEAVEEQKHITQKEESKADHTDGMKK